MTAGTWTWVIALSAAAIAAPPASALPVAPPARPWLGAVAVCPLFWHPGEPPGLFPHPSAPAEAGRLADASGWAARAEARGWIEVGRHARALAALALAPEGPETRLYRLAALRGLERWEELSAGLAEPAAETPPGCEPVFARWSAEAAAVRGDAGAAERAWAELAAARPEIRDYAELWRLEAAARTGDVAAGEGAWARIEASDLPGTARADARLALARLYDRAGRRDAARRAYLTAAEDAAGRRRADLWLAASRQADLAGDVARADALRARVLAREPASAADLVLDPAVRARMGVPALDAARALLAAGRPADAEPFATATVESAAGEERIQEALLLRADIRAALGDRSGAERDYAAFLERFPGDPRVPDVVYEQARLALRYRDGAAARRRLESLLARFPGDRRASAALYLIADSYQDERHLDPSHAERAIERFDRLVRTHPGSTFTDRAAMRSAHLAYALGRFAEAESRYAAYRGGESAREARYWRARALERRGQGDLAQGILVDLARGADYYALLARDRLRGRPGAVLLALGGDRPGPADPYGTWGAELLADPAGRTAAALLALGERRHAAAELDRAVARLGGDRERLEAWASALAAWGFPHLTLRIGVGLGGEAHPFSHPAGFSRAVDREAREHDLDPWIVLALIRQESLYRADAVSPADARGLMQILPTTGRQIADSVGWAGFEEEDLFDPAVNLHFGARYLADQRRRFDGFWPAVLAAYNGGPHVVAVWWDFPERTLDPELWIERIPYRETRNYVKTIVAMQARYRSLYEAAAVSR